MSFLGDLHTDLRRTRLTRRGATHKPEEVPRGMHKTYPRMARIVLPEPQRIETPLSTLLGERHSYFHGSVEGTLPLAAWGTLLGNALMRKNGSTGRQYPSGGALFPIETYVITSALPGYAPGVFHYDPTAHALEKLWLLPFGFELKRLARKPEDLLFSTMLVLTSVWDRSSAKYGDFAYTLSLLEAGHMSQNILLAATGSGLQSRPMAGFDDRAITELLDIDEELEQPIHSIVLSS